MIVKVKIFRSSNVNKIEEDVNNFIKDKEVIDIKQSIGGFETATKDIKSNIVITVIYK